MTWDKQSDIEFDEPTYVEVSGGVGNVRYIMDGFDLIDQFIDEEEIGALNGVTKLIASKTTYTGEIIY